MRGHLSQEALRRIAAFMEAPIRCGGADYDEEGKLRYRIVGRFVPGDVVKQGLKAVEAWMKANPEETNG